jgi:hypothetical protein
VTTLLAAGVGGDVLDFPHDHAAIAWGHFLAQHFGKENTEDFVESFYPPLNELDLALQQLYTERWLETSEGAQLDGVGSIVGIARTVANAVYVPFFGFSAQIAGRGFGQARLRHTSEPWAQSSILGDVEYRTLINLKIAINNGHGTAEELMHAFNTTLNVRNTYVVDVGNGNARVYINDFILSSDPRSQLLDYLVPKAAGVKLWPYYIDYYHTFGFSNQNMGYYGFGIGVLARSPASNIPPITAELSIWDQGNSIWDGGSSVWDVGGES